MKVVLVTGCSTGIGLSTATLFSEGDYQVIATARSPESSEELVELGKKDIVLNLEGDVCVESALGACMQFRTEDFQKNDLFIIEYLKW